MSTYRREWECCGSATETEAWEPEQCPLCELESHHRQIDQLTAALSASELTWSDEPPTEPGWYWYKPSKEYDPFGGKRPYVVSVYEGGLVEEPLMKFTRCFDEEVYEVRMFGGQWYGPIQPPGESK